ncbi:2'-5' RNA ligase family protein [Nocardioides dubius]|uniref:2'-5' RNA ligase family protein n=1 Tax=Nocardioides dubius TaxID=317019 RepID=UPI0031DF27BC
MPDHAFELSFTAACEQAIVQQWLALQAADIPSQADHRSMTNAPHLTLVAAAPIDPQVIGPAVSLIGPLLPTEVRLRGLILLGSGPRITIAHLVEPTAELAEATSRLRALVPGLRHPVWMPHLTLARRVPRRLLPAALEVVHASPAPEVLVADRLRWWDPDASVVEDVAVG